MKNGKYDLVIAPVDFPGKKYRGKYCYEHHLRYWQVNGVIPKENEIIHHKDGNTHNNNPDNLELLTRSYHSSTHNLQRKKTFVELRCPACEKTFIRAKNKTYLVKGGQVSCCSRKCIGNYTKLDKAIKLDRIQKMFVREFKK